MISLNQIGKRFGRNWIFKGINFTFSDEGIYALLGHNGSGKSTLLRIIAGMQTATVGKCIYTLNQKNIPGEKIFSHLAYCAPGLELIEEMTLIEFLEFHFSFKPILPNQSVDGIIRLLEFEQEREHLLRDFSSGMLQRVKLVQAFFADTPILLLDEPCSNLDEKGISLYQHLLASYGGHRLTIIASNEPREYKGALATLTVADYRS